MVPTKSLTPRAVSTVVEGQASPQVIRPLDYGACIGTKTFVQEISSQLRHPSFLLPRAFLQRATKLLSHPEGQPPTHALRLDAGPPGARNAVAGQTLLTPELRLAYVLSSDRRRTQNKKPGC